MKKSYLLFLMIAFGAVCSLASVPEPFEKKGKFGLQDAETGEVLVKPKYTSIVDVADGIAIVADKEYKGIINFQGKELVKCNMTSIEKLSDNYWLMVDNKDRIKVFSKSKSKQIQLVGALKAESNGITLIYATASGIKLGMPMYDLGDVLLLLNDKGQIFVGESALDNAFVAPEEKYMPSSTEYREKGFEKLPTFFTFKGHKNTDFFIYGGSKVDSWHVCIIYNGIIRELHSSFNGDICRLKEINAIYSLKKQQLYVEIPNSGFEYGKLYIDSDTLLHYGYSEDYISNGYDDIIKKDFGLFACKDGYWMDLALTEGQDKILVKCPIPTKKCPFVSLVAGYTDMYIIKNDEGKMGVITPEDGFLLECVSDSIKSVGDSHLMVSSGGKTKIYDFTTGEYSKIEFDEYIDTMRGHYIVEINGKQYIISKDGEEKSLPFDKVISGYGDSLIKAIKDGKTGLFNGTKLLFPFKYNTVDSYLLDPIMVGKTATGQIIACNFKGTILAPHGVYSDLKSCVNNHLIVKKGNLVGIVNASTGKVVVPPCSCLALCANDDSVIIGKELGNGKAKLIAYSDSGRILGTKIVSRLAMYSVSHAVDFLAWVSSTCPGYDFY